MVCQVAQDTCVLGAFLGFRGGPPGLLGNTCLCTPSLASEGRPAVVAQNTGGEAEAAGRDRAVVAVVAESIPRTPISPLSNNSLSLPPRSSLANPKKWQQ